MAADDAPVVDIAAGLTEEGRATRAALTELAERMPIDQWVIVGGQMGRSCYFRGSAGSTGRRGATKG